jgi:predicted AAA+ superfamily ATPase
VRRPKFYFFDTGVLNGLLGNFTVSANRKGLLFEHLVIDQILRQGPGHSGEVELLPYTRRI